MRVGTQFPVAVHALLMVAAFPEKKITSEVVAESAGCNAVIIRNIFADLKDAGLLDTKSGRGRNTLARSAESVTLWDIFCAVEGGETEGLFKLHRHTSETCVVGSNIRSLLLPHLNDTVKAARAELEKVTLADLVAELRAVQRAEK